MSYTYIEELTKDFEVPKNGILSRVLQKDDRTNITLFAFSAGQELSAHHAPFPATIYVLQGEATFRLGDDTVEAKAGALIHMQPHLPHAISAKTPMMMLLILGKGAADTKGAPAC